MRETVGRSVGMLSNLIRRHFSTFSFQGTLSGAQGKNASFYPGARAGMRCLPERYRRGVQPQTTDRHKALKGYGKKRTDLPGGSSL